MRRIMHKSLINPNGNWIAAANHLIGDETAVAHAVIISVRGSAPRELGANMLISENQIWNTIGGGSLEFEVMEQARRLIKEIGLKVEGINRKVLNLALGPDMGQCCGGTVKVLLEILSQADINKLSKHSKKLVVLEHPLKSGASTEVLRTDEDKNFKPFLKKESFILPTARKLDPLFIYGAGHVGRALVKIIEHTDFDIHWVDIDEKRFPEGSTSNFSKVIALDPALIASHAPSNAYHVIITHSHPLDEAICFALLSKDKFRFCGLIGSKTKNARFRSRLSKMGIKAEQLKKLTCPIGIDEINSKQPVKVAISIAAQLSIWQETNGIRMV